MSNTAQDHVNLADALTTQVVDVLKAVERKEEELKKKVDLNVRHAFIPPNIRRHAGNDLLPKVTY